MGVEARSTSHGHLRKLPTFLSERSPPYVSLRRINEDERRDERGWNERSEVEEREESRTGPGRRREERMNEGIKWIAEERKG